MIGRLLAAAMLIFAAPAFAADDAPAIVLRPGERVMVVELGGTGPLVVAPGGQAELTPFDVDALLALLDNYSEAAGPNAAVLSSDNPVPPIAPDALRISFVALDDGSGEPTMLLTIENGFDREFRYRAAIAVGDRSVRTDVCTVLPVLRGYEHWAFPFERIELSELTLLPARPDQPPVCE